MTTKTYDRQTAKYLGMVGENMPEISGMRMQAWIENPMALQRTLRKALASQPIIRDSRLAEVGIESVEDLPVYFLTETLPDFNGRAACCELGIAIGSGYGRHLGDPFNDADLAAEILKAFYDKRPDLRLQKAFLIKGDFGIMLIRGERMDWLQAPYEP